MLIGGDGRIKLTDFGIARSAAENPMTATGLLLGSPAYIAPEVASGATAGPTADAWGLGALLFSCTEGRPPFDKGSPVATLMAVVNEPLPALQRSDAISPVIKGLLVKDPAHRLNLRQARTVLRPLADDPVETRLVFAREHLDGRAGLPPPMSARSAPARVPAAAAPPVRPAPRRCVPRGWTRRRAGPVPGSPVGPAGGAVPPPPWAAAGAAALAPLPPGPASTVDRPTASARPPAAAPSVRVQADAGTRWLIAVLVLVTAALIGFYGVRAIAEAVAMVNG